MPGTEQVESINRGSTADDAGGGVDRERCVTCGGWVTTSEWHPIRVRNEADGPARIDEFCSEHCYEAAD